MNIDDGFDENSFLAKIGGDKDLELAKARSLLESQQIAEAPSPADMPAKNPSVPVDETTIKLERDLNLSDSEEEDGKLEERKKITSNPDKPKQKLSGTSKSSIKDPVKPLKGSSEISQRSQMILPHLHKHDLWKKKIYDKQSTWI